MRDYLSWWNVCIIAPGVRKRGLLGFLLIVLGPGSLVSINGGCGGAGSSINEVDWAVSFPPVFIAGPLRVHCFNHLGAVVVLGLVFLR
jgi:hypothetical protein